MEDRFIDLPEERKASREKTAKRVKRRWAIGFAAISILLLFFTCLFGLLLGDEMILGFKFGYGRAATAVMILGFASYAIDPTLFSFSKRNKKTQPHQKPDNTNNPDNPNRL